MVAQMIGPYRIVEEIGHGGMGVVYKALDTRLNRPVAIKALNAKSMQDERAQKRFLREAMLAAKLEHPYVCKVYELLEHEGENYIVLEFVRGRSLSDLIADPAAMLPMEKVIQYGLEIAEALEEAHKNGIVHRDIKPGNIMLLESGHIKVLDFGLAKALPTSSEATATTSSFLTETGQIVGTLSYMSPEQITGQEVDSRSDIFSFGTVLFEMIAGQKPFSGNTAAHVAASIIKDNLEPLQRYRKGVPEGLDRLIQRMLEKDPNERCQSVHEVRIELKHIRDELLTRTSSADRPVSQASTTYELPAEAIAATGQEPAPPDVRKRHHWYSSKSRQWILGFMSASALMAVILLVLWFQSTQPALSFGVRDWVLISDFENLTGDSVFDKSLATALNVSMSQSTHANVFSKSREEGVLRRMGKRPDSTVDEQVGREICQRENIRGLICPSIGRVGSRFMLTAKIVDPQTGDEVRSYAERADDYNQVLTALDSVARSLRKGLGESLPQIRARSLPLAQVTTTSLPALKSYSDGMQLWAKGQYRSAMDLVLAAVKEDPDFAMAHAALGTFYSSYIYNDETNGKLQYEKALKLVDRTTERERQTIRLQYESHFGTFESSRNLYEIFLRDYPDSITQRYNFGRDLRDHDMVDKAIEQYKEVLRIAPDYAAAYINLATCYDKIDRLKDALEAYDQAFKLEPDWLVDANINREYGLLFIRLGDVAKAREVYTKVLSTQERPMALRSMALLDLYQGRYRDAKQKLQEALVLNITEKALLSEARNHVFMSILLGGKEDPAGSMRELDKAAGLKIASPQVWLNSRIGVGYSRARAADKASRMLDKMRKDVNPKNGMQNSDLHRLEGELALAFGNQDRAIQLLLLADQEQRSPLTVESLARAYQVAGKIDEATANYKTLMDMGGAALGWEPQQSWLGAHVQLAKLYIERKESEKARRILKELLTLWKDADPDLPLNREAQRLSKVLAK